MKAGDTVKKIIFMILCAVLLLSAVGCNGKRNKNSSGDASSNTEASIAGDVSADVSGEELESQPEETSGTEESSSKTNTSASVSPGGSSTSSGTSSKPAVPGKVAYTVDKKLAPLTSEKEREKLLENPDRGFRWELWFDIKEISEESSFESMVANARRKIKGSLAGKDHNPKLIQTYMYIFGWKDKDISAKGLQAIEAVLAAEREFGVKGLVRFAYNDNLEDWNQSATPAWISRHIDQVTPVLVKCKNDIHVIQSGFVGAYAEWELTIIDNAGNAISLTETAKLKDVKQTVINKLTSTMMSALPDIYMQVRMPEYKRWVTASSPYYNRIGINNDAFFGKNPNKKNGSPTQADRAMYDGTQSWKELTSYAYMAPQDGELFWEEPVHQTKDWADGMESILQMSEHRFTSFSSLHGNYDWANRADTAMGRWKNQKLTENWLNQFKLVYCPSFFKKEDGSALTRNSYEFIQYHLGYYVELQSVKTSGESKPGAPVQVSAPVCNYGFSAAFNMRSGFAVLDANNKVVSTVAAGDPSKWYSRNTDYSKAGLLTHNISASMKLPSQSGKYKLAFYLKNDRGEFARIANNVETANGYQILHTFDI